MFSQKYEKVLKCFGYNDILIGKSTFVVPQLYGNSLKQVCKMCGYSLRGEAACNFVLNLQPLNKELTSAFSAQNLQEHNTTASKLEYLV